MRIHQKVVNRIKNRVGNESKAGASDSVLSDMKLDQVTPTLQRTLEELKANPEDVKRVDKDTAYIKMGDETLRFRQKTGLLRNGYLPGYRLESLQTHTIGPSIFGWDGLQVKEPAQELRLDFQVVGKAGQSWMHTGQVPSLSLVDNQQNKQVSRQVSKIGRDLEIGASVGMAKTAFTNLAKLVFTRPIIRPESTQ